MVEYLPEPPDIVTSPELKEGIISGRITTLTIEKRHLSSYQKAADMSGYEVRVIAGHGQRYITQENRPPPRRRPSTSGQDNKAPTINPVPSSPVKEFYVAIALKRPEGVTNDAPFHTIRQRIQGI